MIQVKAILEKINRRMLGANSLKSPNRFTARGVSQRRWQRIQTHHELNYWVHEYPNQVPEGRDRREFYCDTYWAINRQMFSTIDDSIFNGARVVDVGSGPYGSMEYPDAACVIGIDPLSQQYQRHYKIDNSLLLLNALAEDIPLLEESADVVVSVNALDHMCRPYEALEEMYRICRAGGRLLLATDVDGAPEHPCKIDRHDLNRFFSSKLLQVVEQDCGTLRMSGWPASMGIPLYVFHGIKRHSRIRPPAR